MNRTLTGNVVKNALTWNR